MDGAAKTRRAESRWRAKAPPPGVHLGRGFLLGVALLACTVLAQTATPPSTSPLELGRGIGPAAKAPVAPAAPGDLAAQLRARLAEAEAELTYILGPLGVSTNLPPGATASEAIEYRSALQRLVRTYQLHLDDLTAQEAARQRQEELSRTIQAWSGFAEPPPYSVLLVDELRDSIQSLGERVRAAESAGAAVATFIDEAQVAVKESEEKRRRLDEQAEGATEPGAIARLTWQRRLEQARGRSAAAIAASFETKRQLALGELAEARQRLAFAQQRLALAARHVHFPPSDLEKVLGDLAAQQNRLEEDVRAVEAELDARQRALVEAREALAAALRDRPAGAPPAAELRRLQEQVEVRDLERQTSIQTLSVLRQQLEGTGTERQMWQMRYALAGSRGDFDLREASQRLPRVRALVQAARSHYQSQIELAAAQILEEEQRLLSQQDAPTEAAVTRERIASYRQREIVYRRALQDLERRARAVTRWEEALKSDRQTQPFLARARSFLGWASALGARLWQFEIFTVDETVTVDGQSITRPRAVTLGKIVLAIAILAVGYWISAFASSLLERLVRRRLKVESNQANLIRRWVRVVMVLGLIVFSLVTVKIPLTVFAFAGGALAIGVGFGTQNLLKNFISGIVILFERPFRVGDVLAVGTTTGLVTSVGIRSSVIQLWDGTETLIPNSALLENQLTNWTYSNRTVRFVLAVGVAYGSDTRRVAQVLADVADRHGLVEKEPKPQVLFTQFGESSLNFELRYWVDVLKHNAAQIASDLRHMVNGAFRDEGIGIPYPQRDVRLMALEPIPVQMAASPREGEKSTPVRGALDPAPGDPPGVEAPDEPVPTQRPKPPSLP